MKNFVYPFIKKIISYLGYLGIASILFFSCDIENLLQDNEDEYFITLSDANLVAGNLLFPEIEPIDTTTVYLTIADYTIQKDPESIIPIYGNEINPLFFIVNYSGGGFVIISGDKRLNPVLAYSTSNVFSMDQESYPPGLVDWLEEYAELIKKLRSSENKPEEPVELMWEQVMLAPFNIGMIFEMVCPPEHYVEKKKLLQTQWGQGCGYNALLSDTCTSWCNRPPVGCVATAMAQILKYHADNGWHGRYALPNGNNAPQLDWAGMPLAGIDENNHGDIPNLMAHLGQMLDMTYKCDGSGANIHSALNTFHNNFIFNTSSILNINSSSDYGVVISEIRNNFPVYMRGRTTVYEENLEGELKKKYRGHAWVADGYSQLWNCEEGFMNDYMIHMNWGWDGSRHDGYYLKKEGLFDENRMIIRNLRHP